MGPPPATTIPAGAASGDRAGGSGGAATTARAPSADPVAISSCIGTESAPPYRALVPPSPRSRSRGPDVALPLGEVVDDFEILGLLGEGSLARVYLARQVSLGRYVALKASAAQGAEARALAVLEHERIVRIFSASIDPGRGLRLLCMQYVPGTSLEGVIRGLRDPEGGPRDGRRILEIVDALGPHPVAINQAALRERELLERSGRIEAACRIGAGLAEALAYAHGKGVLHRDIKPANILVDPYGRPLLADFNLASDPGPGDGAELFGGSLAYMAPEHLGAFDPRDPTTADAVDERSDIYSLGVVLFELLAGVHPFGRAAGSPAEARRRGAPSLRAIDPEVAPALDLALRRCLEPDPADRHASASELARDLEGCRELRRIEEELPDGPLARAALRRSAAMLALAAFLPHLIGSAINISYNSLQIVGHLTAEQQARFRGLVLAYNIVAYPLCVGIACRLAAPAFLALRAIERGRPIGAGAAAEARRAALRWPLRMVALSCVGWFPGGIIFPVALSMGAGAGPPLGPDACGHFLASFWISGLIALTYSYFGVEAIAVRAIYPRLWADARGARAAMAEELAGRGRLLAAFQLLASLIPLSGAALLVGLGPEDMSRTFRTLIGALIVAGMAGVGLAHAAAGLLARSLAALAGASPSGKSRHPRILGVAGTGAPRRSAG